MKQTHFKAQPGKMTACSREKQNELVNSISFVYIGSYISSVDFSRSAGQLRTGIVTDTT